MQYSEIDELKEDKQQLLKTIKKLTDELAAAELEISKLKKKGQKYRLFDSQHYTGCW